MAAGEMPRALQRLATGCIFLAAATRRQARQLVSHAHFTVNGKKVNIPSYLVKAGAKGGAIAPLQGLHHVFPIRIITRGLNALDLGLLNLPSMARRSTSPPIS